MSLPEVLLWNQLKAGKTSFSFRRQHALGPYVADFYCHQALLVVEVDGQFHYQQMAEDQCRDGWMRVRGVDVLRLDAKSVLESPELAGGSVAAACRTRVALLQARRATAAEHTTPGLEDSATPSACAEGDL